MAGATVGAPETIREGESVLWALTASDGNNTTITHGRGVEPKHVNLTPVGASCAAVLISKSATTIVVNVTNAKAANVQAIW